MKRTPKIESTWNRTKNKGRKQTKKKKRNRIILTEQIENKSVNTERTENGENTKRTENRGNLTKQNKIKQ